MSHEFCPICGEGCLSEQKTTNEVAYKGQTAVLDSFFAVCDVCGVEQADASHLRKNKRQMIAFRKQVEGLLSGAEVTALRERLGITQAQAAEIFGGGPTAFSKYESDDVAQSEAMDKLLRLAHDIYTFHTLKEISGFDMQQPRAVIRGSWKVTEISAKKPTAKKQTKLIPNKDLVLEKPWVSNLEMCA
jgi:HTH-type transcriptional regulator/antitoxin MqsA